ncbi:MAG: ATP-binding protein, partial [Gemmatimonadaceae bacterium]|nr:ATP-binding protein [Gemmatimonadaceae bacterium]
LNVLENARHAGARNVSVAVTRDEERVTISVEDDGSGIAAADLPRVFEPHFSTRTTGSGLGLAISRRLVEAWGGSIDVESEKAAGTTVRIALLAAAIQR